ncbi:glycoside hydrolase family 31 protein [Thermothielavioides terrestris NRRL 8126]|jgi:alpha-glucosidase|uniref:Glycoside hydrolase family 31 protein n=1 Tax=Thermothielavioides terrestris (strain ATCC 38088 / NRRL 8126) TaxID=578455 RepID=G2QWM3_THETT|nr:glycoside hydrolase family 31 protein [Thermothielavioides terrestris NRRL 8126]AEO62233.1 glycoside hydrolase family 31 protein [Thermothielavioides terrestris NRRL 8126]
MTPYLDFGFQNCRCGYRDMFEVAEMVSNYGVAQIPLEVAFTDVDYVDKRRVSDKAR